MDPGCLILQVLGFICVVNCFKHVFYRALEQAASVLKEMKNITEAVSLVERAV